MMRRIVPISVNSNTCQYSKHHALIMHARKCPCRWFGKGSPFDRQAIPDCSNSDLCVRLRWPHFCRQRTDGIRVEVSPYIAAELPANLLLRKIGPRLLMPSLLTIWGIMVTLQGPPFCLYLENILSVGTGLVSSYGGLVTVRAFLGLVEGPMFPGIVLYLSGFYTRKELSIR